MMTHKPLGVVKMSFNGVALEGVSHSEIVSVYRRNTLMSRIKAFIEGKMTSKAITPITVKFKIHPKLRICDLGMWNRIKTKKNKNYNKYRDSMIYRIFYNNLYRGFHEHT